MHVARFTDADSHRTRAWRMTRQIGAILGLPADQLPPRIPRAALGYAAAEQRYREPAYSLSVTSHNDCKIAYFEAARPMVHSLGLTDALLAHTNMISDRPAHKFGLRPYGAWLTAVREEHGFNPDAIDKAVANGALVPWKNPASVIFIEKRTYNEQDLLANFPLAFQRIERLEPLPDVPDDT